MTQSTMESIKSLEQKIGEIELMIKNKATAPNNTNVEKALELLTPEQIDCSVLPLSYFSDAKIISKLIAKGKHVLRQASAKICDDYDIVSQAIAKNASEIMWASDRLKSNTNIAKILLKSENDVKHGFEYLSYSVRSDSEVAKLTVETNGRLLQFVSDELRGDFEIVKIAVSNYPSAYFCATEEMQKHPEVLKIMGL